MTTTYTTISGRDQNGQTIKKYTNNKSKCKSDCNSTNNCQGMVTNGSSCWTVKGFPSPYSKKGSTTYKKDPPANNFDGYTTLIGKDQNGQTINKYIQYNNDDEYIRQCDNECNSTNACQGMVINGSNCWTIKSFPSPYNNTGSATYKKQAPTNNIDGYTTVVGQDQNGQTIKQYTNNQQQCIADCNSDTNCKGAVINGINCWTVKGFNAYNNPGSTTYKKFVYPTPAMSSDNFPTSPNNNLFSSVFCKNISTNNGFIQKENSTFNNLPVYKTESTPDENTCLNNCKNDGYCSSYSFQKNTSSSNCLLYNQVPSSVSNNDITSNIGYKNNYKYDFNNLNSSQKNVIRNDCINNYLNNNYDTNNLNYTSYYTLVNNNSEVNFNAESLANLYGPLGKVQTKHVFTNNPDPDIVNAITNEELNTFSNNYNGYLQTQIGTLNSSNENNIDSYYTQEITHKTNIQRDDSISNLLQKKNINTEIINNRINGTENNNIIENFSNNNESKTIKFYLFIFIVIIFLYIVYYLKKNKHFK